MLPPGRQHPRLTAMVLGVHALYGALVALAFRLLGGRDGRGG